VFSLHCAIALNCVTVVSSAVSVTVHAMIPPPSPLFSCHYFYYCVNLSSASTKCIVFHIFTSSLYTTISSSLTHDYFSPSRHWSKYIPLTDMYIRLTTASKLNFKNSLDSSTWIMLGMQIYGKLYMSSLQVKNVLSRQQSINPAISAWYCSGCWWISDHWAVPLTW